MVPNPTSGFHIALPSCLKRLLLCLFHQLHLKWVPYIDPSCFDFIYFSWDDSFTSRLQFPSLGLRLPNLCYKAQIPLLSSETDFQPPGHSIWLVLRAPEALHVHHRGCYPPAKAAVSPTSLSEWIVSLAMMPLGLEIPGSSWTPPSSKYTHCTHAVHLAQKCFLSFRDPTPHPRPHLPPLHPALFAQLPFFLQAFVSLLLGLPLSGNIGIS